MTSIKSSIHRAYRASPASPLPPTLSAQTVAYIDERNGFLNLLQRQFLRNRRRFWAHLTDGYGNVLFTIHRPFYLINRCALRRGWA